MEGLKELRKERNLTQKQVSELVGISLRSYKSYENDSSKLGTFKYNYIVEQLKKINPVDENHGVLDVDDIKRKCTQVFEKYEIDFCYLFGSYAKHKAGPTSDVDLLISANINGLKFYGLIEEIRNALHKRVDVLDMNQLKDNLELTEEILKEGVKIYG